MNRNRIVSYEGIKAVHPYVYLTDLMSKMDDDKKEKVKRMRIGGWSIIDRLSSTWSIDDYEAEELEKLFDISKDEILELQIKYDEDMKKIRRLKKEKATISSKDIQEIEELAMKDFKYEMDCEDMISYYATCWDIVLEKLGMDEGEDE